MLEGRCSCWRDLNAGLGGCETGFSGCSARQAARSFGNLARLQAAMVIVNVARTLLRPWWSDCAISPTVLAHRRVLRSSSGAVETRRSRDAGLSDHR